MEQISAEERELRSAIVGYIESTDTMCGTQLLDEEAAVERKLGNIRLARHMAELVMDLARCRKLSENFHDNGLGHLGCSFEGNMSWASMRYSIDPPQGQQIDRHEGKA